MQKKDSNIISETSLHQPAALHQPAVLHLRSNPPSSGDLHLRIAAAAADLPQINNSVSRVVLTRPKVSWLVDNIVGLVRHWFSFKPMALAGVSVFAVLALTSLVWLPQFDNQSGQQLGQYQPAQRQLTAADSSVNQLRNTAVGAEAELVWAELLLLQDEYDIGQL